MMHAILAAALTGATESKEGQPTLSVNVTYERLSAMNDAIEATLADNARLRALVKAGERGTHVYPICPWCEWDGGGHRADCPAFTPEGLVK